MATVKEIANELVALCKEGKNMEAMDKLYAPNIVSVEATEGGGFPRQVEGMEAVAGKGKWWAENNEVHSAEVLGPYPHGEDKFAVHFKYDVTFKPQSQRMNLDEIGVYTVADGKVVREEFYYDM